MEPIERAEQMEGLVPMRSIEEEDGARKNHIPLKYNKTGADRKMKLSMNHRRHLSKHNLTRHLYHLAPHVEEAPLIRNPNDHPNVTSDRVLMLPSGTAVVNLDGYQHHRAIVGARGAMGVDHPATGATGAEYAALGAIDSRIGVGDPAKGVIDPATGVTDPAQGVTKEAVKAEGAGPNTKLEPGVKLPLNEGFKKDHVCKTNDTKKGVMKSLNETLCHSNMTFKKSIENNNVNLSNSTLGAKVQNFKSKGNFTHKNELKSLESDDIPNHQGKTTVLDRDFGNKTVNVMSGNMTDVNKNQTMKHPVTSENISKSKASIKITKTKQLNNDKNQTSSLKVEFPGKIEIDKNTASNQTAKGSVTLHETSQPADHLSNVENVENQYVSSQSTKENATLEVTSNHTNLIPSNVTTSSVDSNHTNPIPSNVTTSSVDSKLSSSNFNTTITNKKKTSNYSANVNHHNISKIVSSKNHNSTKYLNFLNDPLYNAITNNKTASLLFTNNTRNNISLVRTNRHPTKTNSSHNITNNGQNSDPPDQLELQDISYQSLKILEKASNNPLNKTLIQSKMNYNLDNDEERKLNKSRSAPTTVKSKSTQNLTFVENNISNQTQAQDNVSENASTKQNNPIYNSTATNNNTENSRTKSIVIGDRRGIVVPKDPIPPISTLMEDVEYPDKIPPIKMDKKDIPMKDSGKDSFDKAPPIEPIDVGRIKSRLLEETIQPNEPIEMQDSMIESNPPIEPIPPIE
ncbi:asparagine-rich protein-like [Clytia hemisphaerica]